MKSKPFPATLQLPEIPISGGPGEVTVIAHIYQLSNPIETSYARTPPSAPQL
jgi:hypothetical protein